MTKTENERVEFLQGLGLAADGDTLAGQPAKTRKHEPANSKGVRLAPPGVDPRTMPVDEIEFDPRLIEQFPSLTGEGQKAAADHVFSLYKSYMKGDRNKVLWRKIGQFIVETRRARETGGLVKEKVKASKPERDMAALLASQGMTTDDLTEALMLLAEKRQEGSA